MPFWKRRSSPSEERRQARVTVVEVGGSVVQNHQSATSLRLRPRVEVANGPTYEVTTAWTVDAGLVPKVQDGATFTADVVDGHPEQVYARDGRISWDRTRTPEDPKVRVLDG